MWRSISFTETGWNPGTLLSEQLMSTMLNEKKAPYAGLSVLKKGEFFGLECVDTAGSRGEGDDEASAVLGEHARLAPKGRRRLCDTR